MDILNKIEKLTESGRKKIIFYFDDDGSFKDELPEIKEAGIEVIEVGQNFFELKYVLEFELKDKTILLYHPYEKPSAAKLKKYPLLDLLKANAELRLDDASGFLSEYKLQEHHLSLIRKYIKQLKVKTNQKKLANILDRENFNEDNLKRGLISIALDFNTVASRSLCIAKWISLALDEKLFEKATKSITSLELKENLLSWMNNLFITNSEDLTREFAIECARKLKYNILTIFIDQPHKDDNYSKLKIEQPAALNKLHAFFNEWSSHPTLKKNIEPVFDVLAQDVKSSNILNWYGTGQDYGYYSSDMINNITRELYEQVESNPLKSKEYCQKWLRTISLTDENHHQITFAYHASNVFSLLQSCNSFCFDKLDDYIREYTGELFKIDLHFRKAVITFEKVSDRLYEFEEAATGVFEKLNKKYDNYLKELNVEWQKLLSEKKFKYDDIPTKKQYDFFKNNLKDFDYKIVVIISDALRYELGTELFDDLMADNKNTVSIEPYMASIPSYTNLGMANLLPHDKITVEKSESDLVFKIQDIPTTSTNRTKILQLCEEKSDTISFSDAMKLNLDSGRKFFSNKRIVYVYHDWIDIVGDKKKTEYQAFEATSKAKEDIKRLIKKVHGWNVYHVMITSDHGFLFNHTELTEASREELPKTQGYTREHSRFVISEDFEGKVDGYTMQLSDTTNIDSDLKVAIPRAINRYRKKGNVGLQFTHGGATLQELLIPFVKLYRQKKEIGQSVSFKRIDEKTKITSGNIKVTLLQDQPVSNEYNSLEIVLGLYSDTGERYSKEVTVNLNSTSTSPKERIYEPILTLNTKGSKANFCYLKAFNKDDKSRLNPLGVNDLLQISSLMEKDF